MLIKAFSFSLIILLYGCVEQPLKMYDGDLSNHQIAYIVNAQYMQSFWGPPINESTSKSTKLISIDGKKSDDENGFVGRDFSGVWQKSFKMAVLSGEHNLSIKFRASVMNPHSIPGWGYLELTSDAPVDIKVNLAAGRTYLIDSIYSFKYSRELGKYTGEWMPVVKDVDTNEYIYHKAVFYTANVKPYSN